MTSRSRISRRPESLSKSAATQILNDLRVRNPEEIRVELIAAHYGLLVRYRALAHQEGHLLRLGKKGIIVVNERDRGSEKGRFTVAHELGHYFQHFGLDQFDLSLCTSRDLNDWYSKSGIEHEANVFAAELLMPAALFEKHCDRNKPSLADVRELASNYRTSLTATAIRFVQFSPEPCAVVHSTTGVIDWSFTTADFAFRPPRGSKLTTATYAGDLFAGEQVDDRPQIIDGSGWPGGVDVDIQEHSVKLGRHDSVLTMLWHRFRG